MDGQVVLTFGPDGSLTNILYQDGSELFGSELAEYSAFMAEKFGDRWESEKSSLRLCHFDEVKRPPARVIPVEGEPRLDPRPGEVVLTGDAHGNTVSIRRDNGTELFGEAIAEWNAMMYEKYSHIWEQNKGKLKVFRINRHPWDKPLLGLDAELSVPVENYRGLPVEKYRTMPVELCTTFRLGAAV